MRRPAVFVPTAEADVRAAVDWIAKDNPTTARALRIAIERGAKRIGARPGIGTTRHRFLLLRGFTYLLVCTADTSPPRILRVLHTSRDLPPLLGDLGP
jgi:plasmid stabilization system protein ParE